MPNRNYERGVRFERERKKYWESKGHTVLRTAGSHGFADLVAVSANGVVTFIQCKVTEDPAFAKRLIAHFKLIPPFGYTPLGQFHQRLEVKVLNRGVESVVVA